MVEDQVSVEVFPNKTEVESADKLTVGGGVIGAVGVEGVLPPPPPPHDDMRSKAKNVKKSLMYKKICKYSTHYVLK